MYQLMNVSAAKGRYGRQLNAMDPFDPRRPLLEAGVIGFDAEIRALSRELKDLER